MTDTAKETVSISIDGRSVEAKPGEMIIAAAERAGTYVPHFCYHPRMKPVGMCRMCLVEVVGPRGPALVPSCFVPVAEGQEVITNSERVKKAQDGVLEFLLVNHPLDCPVCDKGGECPLQDQTFAYGPGESRFVEEKRHWEKPIALSELVLLDRERCIQCSRCTRFANEIAGDPLIEFINRGERTEVNVFPDEPFSSYFSGNTVQICPVGALTSSAYRFKARPWDLDQVESTCTACSVGCRMNVQASADKLVRNMGIDNDSVNQGWLCDKGRYNFESVNSDARLVAPLMKKHSEQIEVSWAEALADVAQAVEQTLADHGPTAIGFIGGARLTNEAAYLWTKLAKSIVGTDNVDAQLNDGLSSELVLSLPQATVEETCSASQIVVLAPDLKEELPVLYLRIRQAIVDNQASVLEIAPRSTGLSRYAARHVSYLPGCAEETVKQLIDEGAISPNAVVVLGRPSMSEAATGVEDAARLLAKIKGVRFLSVLRRGNVRGALELGMAPGLLPGRVDLSEGRKWFEERWGKVPSEVGMNSGEMLRAGSDGSLKLLFLIGSDPVVDFPDGTLVQSALQEIPYVVSVQSHLSASIPFSSVVLPAATFGEQSGTTTNLEGRVTRITQKITAPGNAWPDWSIACELASKLGADFEGSNVESIGQEVAETVPSFAGINPLSLLAIPDGLFVNANRASDAPKVLKVSTPAKPVSVPHLDQYKLRVISSRSLYDGATSVRFSPSLDGLAKSFALYMNPADLSRLGVESGGVVRVRSGEVWQSSAPAFVDSTVPKGCVWIPFASESNGIRTNALLSSQALVNDIFVETQQ